MASGKTYIVYIMFIIFFNFLVGMFAFQSETESSKYTADSMMKSINIRNSIIDAMNPESSWLGKLTSGIVSVAALPFIVIEAILWLAGVILYGSTLIPTVMQALIITPLGLLVLFDYIIPMIRGN